MDHIIKELRNQTGDLMLSLVVSSPIRSFEDKQKAQVHLKNQIKEANKMLKQVPDEDQALKISKGLRRLSKEIDINRMQGSLGIYMSPGFQKLLYFPFQTEEKLSLGTSFDLSAIEQMKEKMRSYVVLVMSKGRAQIFEGKGNSLVEVKDSLFPFIFEQQYQIQRSSPHSFYNSEESEVDQARVENYIRSLQRKLPNYVGKKPLFLLGSLETLTLFKNLNKHRFHIIAEVQGNFHAYKNHEISDIVWPLMEKHLKGPVQKTPI